MKQEKPKDTQPVDAESVTPTAEKPTKSETPELSPFRQRLALHFADLKPDLASDEVADQLACQWAEEMEQALARYTDTEGRVGRLLENQPLVATLIEAMIDEELPLRVAVRRFLDAESLQPQPGDDDYEAFARQKEEADQLQARLEANLKQSLGVLQLYAVEKKLDELAQQQLVDAINADFDNLLERRVTNEMLENYYKRLYYDRDVDAARNEGELKGRNENISAQMAAQKAALLGDGLPQPQGGGYAPKMLKGQQPVIDFSKY